MNQFEFERIPLTRRERIFAGFATVAWGAFAILLLVLLNQFWGQPGTWLALFPLFGSFFLLAWNLTRLFAGSKRVLTTQGQSDWDRWKKSETEKRTALANMVFAVLLLMLAVFCLYHLLGWLSLNVVVFIGLIGGFLIIAVSLRK